jgi:hypothetical protein
MSDSKPQAVLPSTSGRGREPATDSRRQTSSIGLNQSFTQVVGTAIASGEPAADPNAREYARPLDVAMMEDIGVTLSPIPEPAIHAFS